MVVLMRALRAHQIGRASRSVAWSCSELRPRINPVLVWLSHDIVMTNIVWYMAYQREVERRSYIAQ